MSVDTTPEQRGKPAPETPSERGSQLPRQPLVRRITSSLTNVRWGLTLLLALVMAATWCALFLSSGVLQVLAGIVPVMAGLYLGRQIKSDYLAHGLVLGLAGFVFGLVGVVIYGALGNAGLVPMPTLQLEANQPPQLATSADLLFLYSTFSLFALIPFPAFGTIMSGRAEQRNRQLKQQTTERGGQLERPGVVRTLSDLQGLSLPQLGSYVVALFRKKGFEFKDYRFTDKDKHLDLELVYENERYLLRLTVADKVRPGTIEGLVQDMRRREIAKGAVITSTEFAPEAEKAATSRRNLVAINGQTLFDMAES